MKENNEQYSYPYTPNFQGNREKEIFIFSERYREKHQDISLKVVAGVVVSERRLPRRFLDKIVLIQDVSEWGAEVLPFS